ncbi:hypothetical protein OCS_00394 [Ophiocordyceps sinensis CO18]|uniref:Uncharacterized protein n=1 Tax=Ophiocordyceps sinensis (strain Co18 / CGMCC 3.14243) TaxID=911162 RepID=T5AN96_OPHSC|nr:hypothetical protein OCS_00394 [Ophiocordyceps sinensis CO18]
MSKTSSAWLGAPPVSADGFAFADGEFFAQSSGQNRHRRAAHAKLQAQFGSGSDKDHPAHWFEAQLLHYGLKPSKTKAVARMRLLDAFNAGNLQVPSQITKLEGELKKEWTKKNREAKKAFHGGPQVEAKKATPKPKTTAAGSKRRIEVDGTKASTTASSAQPVPKKPRTATPKKPRTATPKANSDAKPATASPANKQTARRGGIAQASSPRATQYAPSPAKPPRTKQTARRSGAFMARGRIHAQRSPSPAPAPRPIQTARRSGAFMARGRMPPPPAQVQWVDDESDSGGGGDSEDYGISDGYGGSGHDQPPPYSEYEVDDQQGAGLSRLGLINGDYDVECPYVTSEWSCYGSEFRMTLTLAGSALWGSFDLGIIEGVLFMNERPWESSDNCFEFTWRGSEADGPIIYGDRHKGWIKFVGGGRIEGFIDYQGLTFEGERCPGQGTRSSRDARSLQMEWDNYSEAEYDRLNRARWR